MYDSESRFFQLPQIAHLQILTSILNDIHTGCGGMRRGGECAVEVGNRIISLNLECFYELTHSVLNIVDLYSGNIIQLRTRWALAALLDTGSSSIETQHSNVIFVFLSFPILRVLVANEKPSWPCE